MRNREAAQASRERKKRYISDLENQVSSLQEKLAELTRENSMLRAVLIENNQRHPHQVNYLNIDEVISSAGNVRCPSIGGATEQDNSGEIRESKRIRLTETGEVSSPTISMGERDASPPPSPEK